VFLSKTLDGLPSSAVVARAFAGAKLVKGFNHLPAAALAEVRVRRKSGQDQVVKLPLKAAALLQSALGRLL
jgi:predicted dinucleotide-binding enzyme